MVENVEKLSADLDGHGLGNRNPLRHAEVGVDDARAVEKSGAARPERAEGGVFLKRTRQEISIPTVGVQFAWAPCHDWSHAIWFIGTTARQRDIAIALVDSDRKSGGEARNAIHRPPLRQAFRKRPKGAIKWDGPRVAGHDMVRDIKRRQPPAQPEVRKIHVIAKSRSVVYRLSERVSDQKRAIGGPALKGGLQGVVVGVGAVLGEGVVLGKADKSR